jgi:hypothetical protein
MMAITEESDFVLEPRGRMLDFGCAAGGVIRCFTELASRHEVWGVDIRAEHNSWCRPNRSTQSGFRMAFCGCQECGA